MLNTGWEDLALNAGALPIKMIDPYFWQNPFNVLITGLEEEEALNACDPYLWQTIHIFGKAPRVTKNGLPKAAVFAKETLILVKYSLQSPV